ncbi:hypothetical protein JZU48_04935, partial [bacterium]|nr:hypothetical protein [bacterium]
VGLMLAEAMESAREMGAPALADRAVLAKIADGWRAAAVDVPRWAWFEDRELIRMEPGADGVEILVLTDLGLAAVRAR